MIPDPELLRHYAEKNSETAFAELVQRYIGLVYSAALRQAEGDSHLAHDITQEVFTRLSRKAASLAGRPAIAGWLHTTTRFAASEIMRAERRRWAREKKAQAMEDIVSDEPSENAREWERLRPAIDRVLGELNERDREAVLLRYFSNLPLSDLGARLQVSENTARMRVERALDKLRLRLSRLGVTSTTGALAALFAENASGAVPAGLAPSVTSAALASGVFPATTSFLQLMATYKQIGSIVAIVAAGGVIGITQHNHQEALRAEISTFAQQQRQLSQLRAENSRLLKERADLSAQSLAERISSHGERVEAKSKNSSPLAGNLSKSNPSHGAQGNPLATPRAAAPLDTVPTAIDRDPPTYPADLRGSGLQPILMVDFIVDPDGNVRNAHVPAMTPTPGSVVSMETYHPDSAAPGTAGTLSPEVQAEFAWAARQAVSQWVFRAGQKNGRVTNTHMLVPVSFTLPESFTPPSQ